MKVKYEGSTVTITMTDDESFDLWNFLHFAVRKNIPWEYEGSFGHRSLHVEDGKPTVGLKETRKLTKKLGRVCGWSL